MKDTVRKHSSREILIGGFLKRPNFFGSYKKKYYCIIGNYLYSGTKESVTKKMNLRDCMINRREESETKFIIFNSEKKYRL